MRLRFSRPADSSNAASIASVHRHEWISRARIVSGHSSGYSASKIAPMRATIADDALVPPKYPMSRLVTSPRRVVGTKRLSMAHGMLFASARAQLPPSKTMSGLYGAARASESSQASDVRDAGLRSPSVATGVDPAYSA